MKKIHVGFIIDRSGSMFDKRMTTIEQVNAFIQEQKALPGECGVTFTLFNHLVSTRHYESIQLCPMLDTELYVTSGMTALYDAICDTVDKIGSELSQMAESNRPDKVIICILTDGLENSSRKFTHHDVLARIDHQREKYSWEFVFLGVGIDAFSVANSLNIDTDYTQAFSNDAKGISESFITFGGSLRNYRSGTSDEYILKKNVFVKKD